METTTTGNNLEPCAPRLNHDAHRRWRANTSVDFLNKVNHIDILETRTDEHRTVFYVLEVHWTSKSLPVLTVERRFSDFEKLRHLVQNALSSIPKCRCQFCLDLLAYIGFKMEQPRGFIKLTAGVDKRKKILAHFINSVVSMSRRRVEKDNKRECKAQLLIPALLEEFLLGRTDS